LGSRAGVTLRDGTPVITPFSEQSAASDRGDPFKSVGFEKPYPVCQYCHKELPVGDGNISTA